MGYPSTTPTRLLYASHVPIQVLRMQKVDGAGGRLGDHIDGVTRPETGIPREGLDPVVLLGSEGETIYSEAAQERTEDAQAYMARCRRRSKSVGGRRPAPCVTFVVAGPPKYGSPTAWKPEKVRAWAADSVKWLVDRSGRGSTLAHCALHQDEGAPHLHATFVVANVQGRLGWNRIRERFGLTGKERGPQLMSAMQDRYHRDVAAKHGLERGERGSKHQHEPIDRGRGFKMRLEEEREKVPARVDALLEETWVEAEDFRDKCDDLTDQLARVREELASMVPALKLAEVEAERDRALDQRDKALEANLKLKRALEPSRER